MHEDNNSILGPNQSGGFSTEQQLLIMNIEKDTAQYILRFRELSIVNP